MPEAETAFARLKVLFTSAPGLTHPDPTRQFTGEVDTLDVGVGAVLSQRSPEDQKLHPCAFICCRLSPAERNYDVGNCDLLALVLALQEWMHWLEGAAEPFVVWTDHKNLAYLQSGSIPGRKGGHSFSAASTSLSHIGQAQKTSSWMRCPVSSPLTRQGRHPSPSCHPPVSWAQPPGRLRSRPTRRCARPPTLEVVHPTPGSSPTLCALRYSGGGTHPG